MEWNPHLNKNIYLKFRKKIPKRSWYHIHSRFRCARKDRFPLWCIADRVGEVFDLPTEIISSKICTCNHNGGIYCWIFSNIFKRPFRPMSYSELKLKIHNKIILYFCIYLSFKLKLHRGIKNLLIKVLHIACRALIDR